jgi:hypothetical protein
MMQITLDLPDELARRALSEGLLSADAVQRMLEDTMRRAAGSRLLQIADQIHEAGIEPMSEEEIAAEVKAYRAEKRANNRAQGLQ